MPSELKLPDLEPGVDGEIVSENLLVVQAIYSAYALEELRLNVVVERIAALFQQGLLPIGQGTAGQALQDYVASHAGLSDSQRAAIYARTFGVPGGDATAPDVNRAFDDLWLRFVSSVSAFARQNGVETLLRSSSASNAHVRCAGRNLALNLSKHAFGLTSLAARLQQACDAQLALLGQPEIQRAFGADDAWDVVDRVNRDYLGGPINAVRARTRAQTGATIVEWLADRVDAEPADAAGGSASAPRDTDLVRSVEAWLAASGVSDETVERYAQPVESPPTQHCGGKLLAIAEDLMRRLRAVVRFPRRVGR